MAVNSHFVRHNVLRQFRYEVIIHLSGVFLVRIQVRMRENTDQKCSEYEHFSRSDGHHHSLSFAKFLL